MSDIRLGAALTGLGTVDGPDRPDDPETAVLDGDGIDAEHNRDDRPLEIVIGRPLALGQDPGNEDEQPRDWKGEPD